MEWHCSKGWVCLRAETWMKKSPAVMLPDLPRADTLKLCCFHDSWSLHSADKCTEQTIIVEKHKGFSSYRLTLCLFIIRKYQDVAMKLAWSHPAVKSQRNIVAASQIACFDLAHHSPINTNHNMGNVVPNYTTQLCWDSKWHFPNNISSSDTLEQQILEKEPTFISHLIIQNGISWCILMLASTRAFFTLWILYTLKHWNDVLTDSKVITLYFQPVE